MKTPKIEKRPGVYMITNTVNGHRYIGSSVNVYNRLLQHKSDLKCSRHGNQHLQNAYDKYGEENFTVSVLLYCEREETIAKEQEFLDKLKPEYNIAKNAAAPALGLEVSTETKARRSVAMQTVWQNEEYREKMSKARAATWQDRKADRKAMAEHSAKISATHHQLWGDEDFREKHTEAIRRSWENKERKERHTKILKERWQDEEFRDDMSEKAKARWKDEAYRERVIGGNKGKTHREETKTIISEKAKARWQKLYNDPEAFAEWKTKQSEAKKGKKPSAETKAKMSAALIATFQSEEQKAKRSERSKKMWEKRRNNPEAMAEHKAKLAAAHQRKKELQGA